MIPNPENRNSEHFNYKATVMIEHVCTGYCYHGTMYYYSGDGIYFESDYAPRPETKIRIRVNNLPFISTPHAYFAKVRWRQQLTDNDSSYSYGIGVKYCKPVSE
jgi:hypothetical protein